MLNEDEEWRLLTLCVTYRGGLIERRLIARWKMNQSFWMSVGYKYHKYNLAGLLLTIVIWLNDISANGYVGDLATRVDAVEYHMLRDKAFDLVEEYNRKINPLTFNSFRAREQGQGGLLKGGEHVLVK